MEAQQEAFLLTAYVDAYKCVMIDVYEVGAKCHCQAQGPKRTSAGAQG